MTANADLPITQLNKALLPQEGGGWLAHFEGHQLSSHFQPIYSFPHRRPVGHEALLRVRDPAGQELAPLQFFAGLADEAAQLWVDRLSRQLHVSNFAGQVPAEGWLFLHIDPAALARGAAPDDSLAGAVRLLDGLGVARHRLVFELTEAMLSHDAEFEVALARARETGCLLALDDFGAGHSNFDRVWRIHPEIVKLDRSLLRRAMDSASVARVMRQMVALLHECGALVLLEGVETPDEALLALDADVDLVQGFAFGRPAPGLVGGARVSAVIEQVWQRFDERLLSSRQQHGQRMAPYTAALKKALPGLRQGQGLRIAAAALLALPGVQLCYLLDEQGCDLAAPIEPRQQRLEPLDQRFEPLERAGQARWARRPYFRRAVAELGQVQVSRPYLSLHGSRMCVTVSLAFWCQAKMQVLCADIDTVGGEY